MDDGGAKRDLGGEAEALFDPTVLDTGGQPGDQVGPAVAVRSAPANDQLLRSYLERRSPWGRLLRWAFVVLVVVGAAHELHAGHHDRKMSEAIQLVSGQPELDVRCRRVWDELFGFRANPGFVEWGSTTANLQLNICRDAAGFADDPLDPDTRVGAMVLSHELAHLVGHRDEATTECVAMWTLPKTAIALGATNEEGVAAARWYATNYNALLRGDYRAPGCLAGAQPASPLLR